MDNLLSNRGFLIGMVIVLASFILFIYLKFRTQKKMVKAFSSADYDGYFKIIDGMLAKYFFSRPQREFLKLNAYMAQGNSQAIMEQIKFFNEARVNQKLKAEVSMRMFNFFLSQRDAVGTKKSLDLLTAAIGEEKALKNKQMYDIYIEKKYTYFDEILAEYEELKSYEGIDPMQLCQSEVMLGYQYTYKKEKQLAREMFEAAIEHADTELYKEGLRAVMKDLKV